MNPLIPSASAPCPSQRGCASGSLSPGAEGPSPPNPHPSYWGDTNLTATAPKTPRDHDSSQNTPRPPAPLRTSVKPQKEKESGRSQAGCGAGTPQSGAAGPRRARAAPHGAAAPAVALLLCTAREGPARGPAAAPPGHTGAAPDSEGRAGFLPPGHPRVRLGGLNWAFLDCCAVDLARLLREC